MYRYLFPPLLLLKQAGEVRWFFHVGEGLVLPADVVYDLYNAVRLLFEQDEERTHPNLKDSNCRYPELDKIFADLYVYGWPGPTNWFAVLAHGDGSDPMRVEYHRIRGNLLIGECSSN